MLKVFSPASSSGLVLMMYLSSPVQHLELQKASRRIKQTESSSSESAKKIRLKLFVPGRSPESRTHQYPLISL
jgi:two-component SAPR family response regulator